jgi:Tol biopolymer transport system component
VTLVCLLALVVAAVGESGSYAPPPGDDGPVWSPDASTIAYRSRRLPNALRVVRADGSGDRALAGLWPPTFFAPPLYAFSPDWRWVAFGGGEGELLVGRPDTEERRSLGQMLRWARPVWSPDGDRLAVARQDGVYVARRDGSGVVRVNPRQTGDIVWSPDGRWVAFSGWTGERSELTIAAADGSGERQLSAVSAVGGSTPTFSPDGSRLAFLTSEPGRGRIAVLVLAETRVQLLGETASPPSLAWAPDGRTLYASANGITAFDVAGGRERLLAPFGKQAVVSPDGAWLAFAGGGPCSDRDGIYVLRISDGTTRRLTNDCTIRGTAGADRLRGTELADVLLGLGGDDVLRGVALGYVGDRLEGGAGDDVLVGTNVTDVLSGGSGRDRLDGGVSADALSGGPGRDVLDGGGGKDVVDAVDGQRDAVTCGTNRGRTTPEQDTGLLDSVDIGGEDCELLYRNGKLVLGRGRLQFTITISRAETRPAGRRWTLRCRPAGGTLPDPARACASLVGARNGFAPVPPGTLCAFTVAGRTARVRGTLRGRPFTADFGRWSTCERERWNRHAFLFSASQ